MTESSPGAMSSAPRLPPPPPPGQPTGQPGVSLAPSTTAPSPGAGTVAPTGRQGLDPRVRTVWRVGSVVSAVVTAAVVTGILAIVTAVADRAGPALLLAGPAVGVLMAALGWWHAARAHARWSWALTDHALELDHGVWWQQTSAVPYPRLQQIDVEQGPLERRLGLVTLHLRTAAASSDGHIPGIAADRADEVRTRILERAGRGDAV